MKTIFFDVDGTLVDSYHGEHQIRESVVQELVRLHDLGYHLFVCSGRPKLMMQDYFFQLPFDGYVLANGGYVEIDGKSVFEDCMDYDAAVNVCNAMEQLGCEYMIETANHIYLNPEYHVLRDFFERFHPGIFTFDFNREEVLKRTIKVESNVMNAQKQSVMDQIGEKLDFVINYDTHGTENAFEFYSPHISKSVGISKAIQALNVRQEDTIGIGDGTNDIEMLKFCGVGVAMGNADELVKQHADIVCGHIAQDGLTQYLQTLH